MNIRAIVGAVVWFAVYLGIWFLGCATAEVWLKLPVPWTMICGIITYQVGTFMADRVRDRITQVG